MYYLVIATTMLVLPAGCATVEHLHWATPWLPAIGRWFVFWGAGVRLLLAGIRQILQPRFTAEEILRVPGEGALALVRELGFANVAAALVAVMSVRYPGFVTPAAITATIFFGAAGFRHAVDTDKNTKASVAMVSDLFLTLVLGSYVVAAGAGL